MKKAIQQLPATLLGFLMTKGWVWKVAIAGLCGSATHSLLMFAKAQLGILESFQPYHSLQVALTYWTGEYVHPVVPWLLSYLNGSTVAGFVFAWLVMDLIFFPLLGLGPFATKLGLSLWPAPSR
jgi:hypothetical protein